MDIQKELDGSTLNVRVSGSIDTLSAPEFESAVFPALEAVTAIVFDFAELEYITSAGLRVLLNIHRKVDGNVTIHGARKEVVAGLDTTWFLPLFSMD